ncbi:MAG: hypothetical protein ACRBB3_09045 [Alphaproteobacteria bacterium]
MPPKTIEGGDLSIETPDDLVHYIEDSFLKSPDTYGYVFHEKNSVCLCNAKDNVAMYLTWNNEDKDFGSIFRYAETTKKFDVQMGHYHNRGEAMGVNIITKFDNRSDPNAVLSAINSMLDYINSNPQDYLFDKNDPNSTVQNEIFGNENRPGRTWAQDWMINSSHNVKGHSEIYAKKNGLNIDASDCICIATERKSEVNIGRVSGSLSSNDSVGFHKSLGKQVRKSTRNNGGIGFTPEPAPAIA